MPDKILDEKQRIKLDEGIRKMVSYGASKDDIIKYSTDFKLKFGTDVSAPKSPFISAMPELIQAEKQGTQKDKPAPTFPSIDEVFVGAKDRRAVAESTIGPNIVGKVQKAIDIQMAPQRKIEREEKIKQTKITALDNTVKKKLDANGIKYAVGDSVWNKTKNDTQKLADSEDIALTVNAKGEPIYKPALGLWGSLIESFKKSYNDEKEAFTFSSANFDDKIKIADEAISKPAEEEGVPTGIGGEIGQFAGESGIMLGQALGGAKAGSFAVSKFTKAPLPVAVGGVVGSFAAMAPSAYSKGKKNETVQRYAQAINELQSKKGFVTYEDKKTAMNTALAQGTRAGLLDVANVAVLSLPFGRVAAGKGLVKTIEHAMKTAAVDVVKFGTSSGVTQLAKDASAKQMGYNVKAADMMNNFLNASGEGAKTALAFWTMHQVTGTIPKYVTSAAKEYLSTIYEPDLTNMSLSLENSGVVPEGTTAETMRKLKKYNAARRKVPPMVPEEHVSSFAGVIEKKDNLEELKKNSDPSFHPKIDEQIAAEDVKLGKMLESENPLEFEVDDRTGDSGIPEPQTAADVEIGVEAIEGPEKEAIKIPVADMVGKRVRYKGKDATIFRDGMQYIVGIEGTNREIELGNVDEVGNTEISNFGIEYDGEIEVADDNSVTVRGKRYENNYSDPKSAVEYDDNGYVRSVTLDTPTGQKRTFRGTVADEIAYQIKLKEIEQNDETAAEFEQFVEQDESAKQQIISAENEAVAEKGAVKVDEGVLREKAEPTAEPVIEKVIEPEQKVVEENLFKETRKDVEKVKLSELPERAFSVGMTMEKFDKIKSQLEKEGFTQPIIIDRETGNVLDGQSRLMIAQDMGIKEVPAIYMENPTREDLAAMIDKLESQQKMLTQTEPIPETIPAKEPIEQKKEKVSINTGEQGTTIFAEGVEVPFRYKIIESDELKPSHLPSGERNPEHTIALAQPKERNDIESKLAQDNIARNPRLQLSGESPNVYSGAPIVNARGEVIQGNNRSIGLKKHYANDGVSYKQQLENNAEKFGLTKEQVAGMKNPVLVREVVVNDAMAVELGNYDVKDIETGGRQRIDPITTVRKLAPEDKQKLSSVIFDGDYATVKEAIRMNPKEIGSIISKYINAAQRNTIFDKEGNINAKGMDDIENIVNNLIFESGSAVLPEAFNEIPYSEQKNIQKAIKYIFSIPEEASILPEVQAAIKGLYDFHTSGMGNFENWLRQADVFEGKTPKDIFNPLELKIMEIIHKAKTQSALAKELAKYSELVNGKPADMFDAEVKGISKEEAIKKQFNIDYANIAKRYAEPKSETGAEKIVREKSFKSRRDEIPREDRLDREYREGEREAIQQQLEKLGGIDEAYKQFERDGYKDSGWGLEDYLLKKACE